MPHSTSTTPEQGPPDISVDPVAAALRQAEARYQEMRESWESQAIQFRSAQERLNETEAHIARLKNEVKAGKEQLELERRTAERQRVRADQLASNLKDIHRSLFEGNIYSLILKACLTISGATRGLYITARGEDDILRIRAAVDVDGYPQSPPSEFIKALCHKVLEENDTFVCNEGDKRNEVPEPSKPSEEFRNFIAAPVMLLKNFDGIIISADKLSGDFDKQDVETLLSVGDQASVAVENVHLHRELQSAYLSTVSMLADAVEAKDPYTHGHCEMVSRYARLVAERLELAEVDKSLVCYGALLHDVGKIGVSDGVLNKPGPLLPEERDLVRSHVRVGHDLISRVPALGSVAEIVLHHHEWWDGTGYPNGLKGEEIPIAARIVCVVDAYSAMITKRSYKEAYSDARAREELVRCAGAQFDAKVVDAFLEVLDAPEAQDEDEDEAAECGLLPGFNHIRDMQQEIY